jgi:hypothetical protein
MSIRGGKMCSFSDLLVKLLYRAAILLPSVEQECGINLQEIERQQGFQNQFTFCSGFFLLLRHQFSEALTGNSRHLHM